MKTSDDRFVGVLEVTDGDGGTHSVLVLLRSAEGYASVCVVVDRKDPTSVLNRLPTQNQYEAISLASSQLVAAFLRLGLYPQMELLGNNSHFLNDETGKLELGNTHEPSSPHFHVTGRGDPTREYIEGVPLRGLRPYNVMVPRERHEEWGSPEESLLVARGLADSLEKVALHPDCKLVERKAWPQTGAKKNAGTAKDETDAVVRQVAGMSIQPKVAAMDPAGPAAIGQERGAFERETCSEAAQKPVPMKVLLMSCSCGLSLC